MKWKYVQRLVHRTIMDDSLPPAATDTLRQTLIAAPSGSASVERWNELQRRIYTHHANQQQSVPLRTYSGVEWPLWFIQPRYSLLVAIM